MREYLVTVEHAEHGSHETYVQAASEAEAVKAAAREAAVDFGTQEDGWERVSVIPTNPGDE
jgi:hypothetical protein